VEGDDMMNDDTLRSTILVIADDGLDVDRTLDVLAALRRSRQRRRQVVSLLSAAAIVVVVVLLIGTSFGGLAAPRPVQPRPVPTSISSGSPSPSSRPSPKPSTTAPSSTARSTTMRSSSVPSTKPQPAAPVTLVAYTQPQTMSPVRATALDPRTQMEWQLEPGKLWVAWRSYDLMIVQTPTSQPDQARGYVISGAGVAVPLSNRETGTAVTGKESAAMVNGHAAVLTTAPAGTFDDQGYPAQSRLSWKLPDGRSIHVFDTDLDATTKTLQQFADSIRDVAAPLDRTYTIGQAPKGFRLSYADHTFLAESFSLCPVSGPADIKRCLTISTGDATAGSNTTNDIQGEGDQHAVSNGTLYVQLSKNRALLFAGTVGVEIVAGFPMTAAQFTLIAESLKGQSG
jgi:hypothetical protein